MDSNEHQNTSTSQSGMEEETSLGQGVDNVSEINEASAAPQMAVMSEEPPTPEYGDPKSYLEAPFAYRFSEREHVELASGGLELREEDFTLPGKNGFDLVIARKYSSSNAGLYEMNAAYNGGQLRTERRDNRHNLLQYGLGIGWSFALPSIETTPERIRDSRLTYSDFLHLSDGRTFEIVDTDGVLSLKDYTMSDIAIEAAAENSKLTHPRAGEISYDVIVSCKDGGKDYFKKVMDGEKLDHYTLIAREDKFESRIFFELTPYGGMTVTDSWGREIKLIKRGEILTWTLPASGENNPLTASYETSGDGKRLVGFTDQIGRETKYSYHDPDVYSAVCKYVSAQYGDTTDTSFPWLLLKEISHPSGAKTLFGYGNDKEAEPQKLNIGEYGGFKQSFPILLRKDISENEEYSEVGYRFETDEDAKYIESAYVDKLDGVRESYEFADSESKNQLVRYERKHDDKLVKSVNYHYGTDSGAADYRLLIRETEKVYGSEEAEKVTSYTYSSDKKANVTSESVSFTGEGYLNTQTTYTYGANSVLTERKVRRSALRQTAERYVLNTALGSLVPSRKMVYDIGINGGTLKEKTEYLYGAGDLKYCVVEERRFYGSNLENGNEYCSTFYGYDAPCLQKPTSVTRTGIADADGNELPDIVERTEYDIFGNVTRTVDGCGNDTLYELDELGREVKELSPKIMGERSSKTTFYDDKRNRITTSDENGNYTRVEYSGLGLPLRAYIAFGEQPSDNDILAVEYFYDRSCRLVKELRYDGKGTLERNIRTETLYRYDAFDRVIVKENPAARYYETHRYSDVVVAPWDTKKVSLDETTVWGEDGAPSIVSARYTDRAGNVAAEYLAGELRAKYTYDFVGNKLSQTDALGNVTTFSVDYAGRTTAVLKQHDGETVIASTVYDPLGNKASSSDFLGNLTRYTYDAVGRNIKTSAPFDSRRAETKSYYDPCGRLKEKRVKLDNRDFRKTIYFYDERGRLTDSYSNPTVNGQIQVHTEYDAAGNKLSISSCEHSFTEPDAEWQTQSYTYDRFNNVLSFTDLAGKTERNSYDAVGRLISKTLRDGTVLSCEYDEAGRVCKETAVMPDDSQVVKETKYCRNGQKKRETLFDVGTVMDYGTTDYRRFNYGLPTSIRYVYNAKGQLTEQTDPDGERKVYAYDLSGNRTSFKLYLADSVEPDIDLCYTYDNSNRLTALKRGNATLASYVYDANGRKTSQTNANGTSTLYTYNRAGLVTLLENKLGDDILSSWSYEYRLDGVQTAKTDMDGYRNEYVYDAVGRLLSEQTDNGAAVTSTIEYTYDGHGNRTSVTATGFPAYEVDYTYDSANRLISEIRLENDVETTTTHDYDENGNLIRSVKGTEVITT